jgi:hypothetical protein
MLFVLLWINSFSVIEKSAYPSYDIKNRLMASVPLLLNFWAKMPRHPRLEKTTLPLTHLGASSCTRAGDK